MNKFLIIFISGLILASHTYSSDKIIDTKDECRVDERNRRVLDRTVIIEKEDGTNIDVKQSLYVLHKVN